VIPDREGPETCVVGHVPSPFDWPATAAQAAIGAWYAEWTASPWTGRATPARG
jgi:hypothetical protein